MCNNNNNNNKTATIRKIKLNFTLASPAAVSEYV